MSRELVFGDYVNGAEEEGLMRTGKGADKDGGKREGEGDM